MISKCWMGAGANRLSRFVSRHQMSWTSGAQGKPTLTYTRRIPPGELCITWQLWSVVTAVAPHACVRIRVRSVGARKIPRMPPANNPNVNDLSDPTYTRELRAGVDRLRFDDELESRYRSVHLRRVQRRARIWF